MERGFFLFWLCLCKIFGTFSSGCLMHQYLGNAPLRCRHIQTEVNVAGRTSLLSSKRYQKPLTPVESSVQKPHVTHSRKVNGFIGSSSVLTSESSSHVNVVMGLLDEMLHVKNRTCTDAKSTFMTCGEENTLLAYI